MRAVTLKEYGPPENLTYETVEDPTPGPGELRIAVRVAGVHAIDTVMRAGQQGGPPPPELPTVFGSEAAGVVDAVGPGVDESWIGRHVVTADATSGGYAELTVAPVEAVVTVPQSVDHQTAVAMVRTGATTLGMLEYADLTADDVVLITSAAGGIGQLLVRHAESVGATVVGVAGGPEKTARVQALGADLAVDYRRPGWPERIVAELGERPLTLVMDGVGGDAARNAFELLADGGRMVIIGSFDGQDFEPSSAELEARGLKVTHALLALLERYDQFNMFAAQALRAAAEGRFVPGLHAFGLSQAAEAHRALENRQTSGKVILEP